MKRAAAVCSLIFAAAALGHEPAKAAKREPASSVLALSVPPADPNGPKQQSKALLETPEVKIVSIRLRQGATLPEHASPFPVLIEAVSGTGTVVVGDQKLPLDVTRFVSLPAGKPHAVTQDAQSELVLLVHHLRGGRAPPSKPAGHE